MNTRTLALFFLALLLAAGTALIIVGAVVKGDFDGILIGIGVALLTISGLIMYKVQEGSSSATNTTAAAKGGDLEKGTANAVEQQLLEERIAALYTFKILILGAGESGKSTVVKQLRLVHNSKISPQQTLEDGNVLHQNIIDCFAAVTGAAARFKIPLENEDDEKTAASLSKYQGPRISPEHGRALQHLYDNVGFQKAFSRRAEYWILDAFSYYAKHLERITSADFVPTEEDSLMVRIRTTGIVVTELESKVVKVNPDDPSSIRFQIVDVGGQRNERKKWIHCFDDVKAVLFVASLAGYNQVMYEDNEMNRLKEDLNLFEEMSAKDIFKNTPFFLFLNKKDLFEVMIREKGLESQYPEFKGGDDVHASIGFLEGEFRKRLPPGKELIVQVVASVWRRDIRSAFEEVKKALIEKNKEAVQAEMKKLKAGLKKS